MAYLNQKGVTNLLMLNFMGRGPTWMGGAYLPTCNGRRVGGDGCLGRVLRPQQSTTAVRPVRAEQRDGLGWHRRHPAWNAAQHVRVMRKLVAKLDALGHAATFASSGPIRASVSQGVNDYIPALMADSTTHGETGSLRTARLRRCHTAVPTARSRTPLTQTRISG